MFSKTNEELLTFQIHKTEEMNLSGNAGNADCIDQAEKRKRVIEEDLACHQRRKT